jgi:uncharacterized protein YndB with AHSA1/START domain
MPFEKGTPWVLGGVLAIDAPRHLELTFRWGGADPQVTPVVIDLVEGPDGTCELSLVHNPTEGGHACEEGWEWPLSCLAESLEDRD